MGAPIFFGQVSIKKLYIFLINLEKIIFYKDLYKVRKESAMAENTLIKMKTGTIAKLEQKNGNSPAVPLDKGAVYFAVDTNNHVGQIVYDAPNGTNGVDRIVMGTQAEYADYAGEAAKATGITGIYPVKGTQTATTAS